MGLFLLHRLPLRSSPSCKTCAGRAARGRLLFAEPLRVLWEEQCGLSVGGRAFFRPASSHGGNSPKRYTSLCQPKQFLHPSFTGGCLAQSWGINHMEVITWKSSCRSHPLKTEAIPGDRQKTCSLLPVHTCVWQVGILSVLYF